MNTLLREARRDIEAWDNMPYAAKVASARRYEAQQEREWRRYVEYVNGRNLPVRDVVQQFEPFVMSDLFDA